jgi:hypothetical protein
MSVAAPISFAHERGGNLAVREQICSRILRILPKLYTIFSISLVQRHRFLHGTVRSILSSMNLAIFGFFFSRAIARTLVRVCRLRGNGRVCCGLTGQKPDRRDAFLRTSAYTHPTESGTNCSDPGHGSQDEGPARIRLTARSARHVFSFSSA